MVSPVKCLRRSLELACDSPGHPEIRGLTPGAAALFHDLLLRARGWKGVIFEERSGDKEAKWT